MKKLQVDIWSDIACPWCSIGKRRIEAALEKFPHRDDVKVTWRAFELNPAAPKSDPSGDSHVAYISKKLGWPEKVARERLDSMTALAKKDGLDFRFDRIQTTNTFDAHRLVHLAEKHGKQDAMKERLLKAYMTEGELLSDHATLVRLATEVGLDQDEAQAVLSSDDLANEVRADEREAHQIGINGVPFFVIGRYGVSGAQPAEALLQVLDKAWSEAPELAEAELQEGAACGADGCV
jgi:predicted DsbA family dithiol-disulfide isomerase